MIGGVLSAAGRRGVIFALGDQIGAQNVQNLYTTTDSPIRGISHWYNDRGQIDNGGGLGTGWGSGWINPADTTINGHFAAGRCFQQIVWLADVDAYAVSPQFYNTDLPYLLQNISMGHGPNYGEVYVVLFTEKEGYDDGQPRYAERLRMSFHNSVAAIRGITLPAGMPPIRVGLGFGGYNWSDATPVLDLSAWETCIAASDFTCSQFMQYAPDWNLLATQLRLGVAQLGSYGKPVMVSHFELWGQDATADPGWTSFVTNFLANDAWMAARKRDGLFFWGFMDEPNINNTANEPTWTNALTAMRKHRARHTSFTHWSGPTPAPATSPPAIDASSPAAVRTATTTRTTASFTPPSGSLLVALVANNSAAGVQRTHTLSDSAGGSWEQRVFIGDNSGTDAPGVRSQTEIWVRRQGGTSSDALVNRIRSELGVFTTWLTTNGAKGFIGEVGWPRTTDSASWNALAAAWYTNADTAGLWATSWATGEWWDSNPTSGYNLLAYGDTGGTVGVDTAFNPATIIEAHPSSGSSPWTTGYGRGINAAGAEFNDGTLPGVADVDYHYNGQATFDYLFGRGIRLVRIPFRWERIQRTLGGALDSGEQTRLVNCVNAAGTAGLKVVLDVHNYGGYKISGVNHPIGDGTVTQAHFADLWTRLTAVFKANAAVVGYGLMNEPNGTPVVAGTFTANGSGYSELFNATIGQWHGTPTPTFNTSTPIEGAGQMRASKTWAASGADSFRLDNGTLSSVDRSAFGLSFRIKARLAAGAPTDIIARLEVNAGGADRVGSYVTLVPGSTVDLTVTITSGQATTVQHWSLDVRRASSTAVTTVIDFDQLQQGTITGALTGEENWEAISQAALNAIRTEEGAGAHKTVLVPGANWSGVQGWSTSHPDGWITDSASNFRYEAHHYWDRDNSGDYPDTYASEVTNAEGRGFTGAALTVTDTLDVAEGSMLKVVVLISANVAVPICDVASASGTGTAAGVTLTTRYPQSLAIGVVAEWNTLAVGTAGTGCTVSDGATGPNITSYVLRRTAATATPGAAALTTTAPTTGTEWNLAAAEFRGV